MDQIPKEVDESKFILSADFPAKGTWCGIETSNNGQKNSIRFFANNDSAVNTAAKTIQCDGHDPKESCPVGYTRFTVLVAKIGDNFSDVISTCVKS